MTSYSRNTAQRDLSNSFSNYFDSKYPGNSRSNFTFHEFTSDPNLTLLDDSLLKRFSGFSDRVLKYSSNINHRLTLASKDVEVLESSVEEKTSRDSGSYNGLLAEIEEIAVTIEQECEDLNQQKSKTSDEECRWMAKQLTEIKNGFKDIQKERKEEIKVKLKQLNEDIEEVHTALEKQKVLRDEISQSQIQQFGEEILKIQELLSLQREERIRNNNMLLAEIEAMDEEIQGRIEAERANREKKQALFTTLLEETYRKLYRI